MQDAKNEGVAIYCSGDKPVNVPCHIYRGVFKTLSNFSNGTTLTKKVSKCCKIFKASDHFGTLCIKGLISNKNLIRNF